MAKQSLPRVRGNEQLDFYSKPGFGGGRMAAMLRGAIFGCTVLAAVALAHSPARAIPFEIELIVLGGISGDPVPGTDAVFSFFEENDRTFEITPDGTIFFYALTFSESQGSINDGIYFDAGNGVEPFVIFADPPPGFDEFDFDDLSFAANGGNTLAFVLDVIDGAETPLTVWRKTLGDESPSLAVVGFPVTTTDPRLMVGIAADGTVVFTGAIDGDF